MGNGATSTYHYEHAIGGIIIDPTDGDNEADYIISAETDHMAGTVTYCVDAFERYERIYQRNVPNTPEWRGQALDDIEQLTHTVFAGQSALIYYDEE